MLLNTPGSPHIHAKTSVSAIMLNVVLALVPAMVAHVWFFGWGILVHMFIAATTALLTEAFILYLRKKPISPALLDGSALVTAILIAFCIPPLAPWWISLTGTAFAIVIAKHLYGGLGYNPFNPAMVGYAMLLISFPREMTAWLSPDTVSQFGLSITDTFTTVFTGHAKLDAVTMASPLDTVKTELARGQTISYLSQETLSGVFSGEGWGWCNIAFLLGGAYLLYKKIIHWHIPVAVLSGLVVFSAFFYIIDNEHYLSPLMHIFSGATMICAFFIATDPVTASTTPKGRLIYGAGIGILIYIIRTWGGYPDAVAFAVLLMNIAVPTIDHYTKPCVFGKERK